MIPLGHYHWVVNDKNNKSFADLLFLFISAIVVAKE